MNEKMDDGYAIF